jgi:hypothetical protein
MTEYATYGVLPDNTGEVGCWSLLDLRAERST